MNLRGSFLYQFIIIWTLIGFSFLSGLTSTFGLNNTLFSLILRALAVLAAITISIRFFKTEHRLVLWLFLAFWIFYFVRLYISLYLLAEPVSRSHETYWIWSVGACFLPSLAILVGYSSVSFERLRHPPVILFLATAVLLLAIGRTTIVSQVGETYDISRLNLSSLNPVSMGHVGVTVFLLGVGIIATGPIDRREKFICLAAISTGAALAVLANSRGPILSLIVAVSVLILAQSKRRRTYWVVSMICAIALYFAYQRPEFLFGDLGPFARFSTISLSGDAASIARFTAFKGSWAQFLGSPIFGDGIEERVTQFYPHNVILEAFMSTGLLGGVPFLLVLITAIRSAWGLFRLNSQLSWVGLVALQQLVGAQFSGSIWGTGSLWVMMMLVIVCWRYEKKA